MRLMGNVVWLICGGLISALGWLLAGLAVGIYKDLKETASGWHVADSFRPQMSMDRREELLTGWHRAVDGALHWAEMNR